MTNIKLSPSSPQTDPYWQMQLDIFREHLRQAQLTFNLSFVAITASLGISVTGGVLLFSDSATEGTVTAAAGLVSTTFCTQIAKESSEKLEQLSQDLKTLRSSPEE